ncbi:rhomboid family intramembrane serine protease [Candidatus Pacearchaeota archaeon]|nr:rhomboid family intramembrane serine protease [Candidatus Pacearchaeota archaeon]
MRFYALILSALCILVFIVQAIIPGFTEALLLNSGALTKPWRFVTALFLHGDPAHLLYNLFALALFGSMLEKLIGSRRFLFVFFLTGILANLIAFKFYPASLGASGAIFGVIGVLVVVRPSLMVFAFGLPMPIIIAGILWSLGDIIGIFVPSNVGNIAHLAGMGSGLLLGALYRDKHVESRKERYTLDENEVRRWEDYHLRGARH